MTLNSLLTYKMSTYQKKGRKSTIMDVSKNLKYILKVWEHFKIEKFKAYIILEEQEKKKDCRE